MIKVAVIEDDLPTSQQLKEWILAARPDIVVDQWFTRDEAEAAVAREDYALVTLDIELGRERNAGVAIINAINKGARGTPVLVVSAMPAAIYRSIMKALDAWRNRGEIGDKGRNRGQTTVFDRFQKHEIVV